MDATTYDHSNLVSDIDQMVLFEQLPQFTQRVTAFLNENDVPVLYEKDGENKSLEIAQKLMTMGQPNGWFHATEERLQSAQETLQGHRAAYETLQKDLLATS